MNESPHFYKWKQPPTLAYPFTSPGVKAQLYSEVSHLCYQLADPSLPSPLDSDSFA